MLDEQFEPRVDVLRDVLTLAERERPFWAADLEAVRASGVPMNDGPEGDPAKGEPDPNADKGDGNPAPGSEPDPKKSGSPEDDIDWKKRYEDLRPEADRRASTIADLEGKNGPERQAEALRQFNVELEADDDDDELDDDPELRDPLEEVDEIREELANRDEDAKAAEFDQLERKYVEETVEKLESDRDVELGDDEYGWVVTHALMHRDEESGRPDLEGGFEQLKKLQDQARDGYRESKRAVPPPLGTEGEQKVDLKDPEARRKYMAEVYEAEEGQES